MIAFIKRLWRDRRGNALVIAGAALPLLVGSAGLAVDTIQWAMWKRQLQRAADSAAFAGVYAKVEDNQNMTASQAVAADLLKHNTTGISLLSGYPQIAYPTGGGYTDAVKVTLAVQKRLGFSSLFMSAAPIITTSGTAALIDDGTYCVVALAETGSALLIGGSSNVQMGCGAISNSTDPTNAVVVNGNSHNFVADPVAAVGGMPTSINGASELQPFHIAMQDPYENLSTSIPAGTSCTNFNSHLIDQGNNDSDGDGRIDISAGCYSNFNPGNGTYELEAGTYYLDSTNLSLSGQTRLVGTGVTIILTGSNPGSLSMNGNSSMDLTAPTTGTYANMLLMQAAGADVGNNNTINGDNNTALDGAIYFPSGDITFTGSSANSTQCAMVVAYTVEFTGSAHVQNNTGSCDAATQVVGKKVRLIG
jgi:Flp pilus assembly protein TadG